MKTYQETVTRTDYMMSVKKIVNIGMYDGWPYWKPLHRFPLDVYATEIIGQHADGEILKERILDMISNQIYIWQV